MKLFPIILTTQKQTKRGSTLLIRGRRGTKYTFRWAKLGDTFCYVYRPANQDECTDICRRQSTRQFTSVASLEKEPFEVDAEKAEKALKERQRRAVKAREKVAEQAEKQTEKQAEEQTERAEKQTERAKTAKK